MIEDPDRFEAQRLRLLRPRDRVRPGVGGTPAVELALPALGNHHPDIHVCPHPSAATARVAIRPARPRASVSPTSPPASLSSAAWSCRRRSTRPSSPTRIPVSLYTSDAADDLLCVD